MTNGRGSSQRLKFEDVKQLFADRGFELLEDTYVNTRTKMKFKCTKNHISSISVDNLKKGCNCSECAGNKKLTTKKKNNLNKNVGREKDLRGKIT